MKKRGFLLFCLIFLYISVVNVPVAADDSVIVRVGIYENEPKIFTDAQGDPSGFWPELIEYIASEENWKIEYVHGTWEQCLSRMETGEIDLMPDMAFSEERDSKYAFSEETLFVSWSNVYTLKSTDIQSIPDLEGKTVAVLTDSINVGGPQGIRTLLDAFYVNCTLVETGSYFEVFSKIQSGEVDAGVASKSFGNLSMEEFNLRQTPILLSPASLRFAISKNSSLHTFLLERINYHVDQLKTDSNSIYYQAMDKWLGIQQEEKNVFPVWVIWTLTGAVGFIVLLLIGSYLLHIQVRKRTQKLREEMDLRENADTRNVHLNSVLKALRNVNQLIVHEKNRQSLIQRSCDILVETRGIYCAWILLLDENKQHLLSSVANTDKTPPFREQLQSEDYPPCLEKILSHKDSFALCDDLLDGTGDCLIRKIYQIGEGFITRLEYEGKVYGIISMYVPKEYAFDPEEQSLFQELAGDIAFALYNIEQEENQKKAEERIIGLAKFPDENPNPVIRISLDGRVLYANNGAGPILDHWQVHIGEMVKGECNDLVNDALNLDKTIEVEHVIDGRTYSCFIVPVVSAGYVNIYGVDISHRREAELLLEASEGKYRSLIQNSDDAILLTTLDGGIESANPAACRIFGRTEEEICRLGRKGIVDLNDPRLAPLLEERRRTGVGRGELTFLRKDGSHFTGEITSTVFFDNEGKTKTSMVVRDVTEREKDEEELLLRATLLDNASDGICLFNPEGKYLYVNETYCRIHGCQREEIIGVNIRQMDVNATEDWFEWLRNELRQQGTAVFDSVHHRKDGTIIELEVHSTDITIGSNTYNLSIERDVSARKKGERLLQESEERYRTLFETMSQGVVYQSAEGEIVMVNPAAERILGLTVDQMMGRTSADPRWRAIHEDGSDFPGEEHPSMVALRTGKPVTGIIMGVFNSPENQYHWIEINAIPLFSSGEEKPYQAYTTFTDITERYLNEAAINRMNRELLYFASQVPGMIYQFKRSPDGIYTMPYANDAIQEIFGCTPEEVRESFTPIGNVIVQEDLQQVIDSIEISARDLTPWEFEFRVQVPSRDISYVWGRSIPDKQGDGSIVWFGFATDITERKQSEESLRASEVFNASLLQNAPNPINVINPDTSIRYVNPALEKLTGYSAEELIGQKAPYPFWGKQTGETYLKRLNEALKHGLQNHERMFTRKNGEEFWVRITNMPVKTNGELDYLLASWIDITESKVASDALQRSEERFRTMVNSMEEIVFTLDTDMRHTGVFGSWVERMGVTPDYFLGKTSRDIFGEPSAIVHEEANLRALKGEFVIYEWEAPTGTELHYYQTSLSPMRDGNGSVIGIVGIGRDITEQKQTANELSKSEQTLRTTMDSMPQGLMVTDNQGAILHVNKTALKLYGCETEQDIIGKNGLDFADESDHQEIKDTILKAQTENTQTSFRYTAIKKNGDTFTAEMSVASIKDTSEKSIGMIGVFEDITEQLKMQENLIVTDRLASVGELAAGIAHELNNPLTGVVGFSDLLLARDDIPSDIREDLELVNKEALRASQVARHLLTFSRKHPDEKKPININDVIKLVLELRAYEQRVNNIDVILNLDENLPDVLANDFQLQQVFINIIINAEHFMIQAHGKGKLTIATEYRNSNIRAALSDDGPGIPPEHINRIFDPFYTTKEVGKGTGLGLSICYGIITEHGGKIWAESEIGKGATFIIELPTRPVK